MEITQAINYYWRVLSRGLTDTWEGLGLWTIGFPVFTLAVGLIGHTLLAKKSPALKERLGDLKTRFWLGLVYGLGPIAAIVLLMAAYNIAVAPVRIDREQLKQIASLTPSEDLDLYFFAFIGAAGQSNIQYTPTLTNRSSRTMHLEFFAHVDYWKDNGSPHRLILECEWNPDGLKEGTGFKIVDLESEASIDATLVIFLPKPEDHGVKEWRIDATENVYLQVNDSVTGNRIAFKAMPGNPKGKVEYPIPGPEVLLKPRASDQKQSE